MSHSASSTGAITGLETRPLVSAIMVTRNQESFIREGIEGLMEQSVADLMEVIVVDAGSEQSEWAVVADLQRRHRNLISLRTPGSAGINLALKIASGRYLTILDASDRMKKDGYQALAQALEQNPEAMLAYGDTCLTAIPHESFASHTSYGRMIWPDYTPMQLANLPQVAPHPMWRRELNDSIGFSRPGEEGMRAFLQRTAERYPMIHIQEFTGLKLVSAANAATQSRQQAPVASLPHAAPAAAGEPEPVIAAQAAQAAPVQPTPPAARAMLSAEDVYLAIEDVVHGADQRQAASALEMHLMRYPDHAVAHNDLGALSYQLGEKEKALNHYRTAVRLAPEESTYQKNLADMLFVEAGEVDEAIGIYLEILKKSPRDVETLLNLGIISDQVGQPAEAESFLQRALEIEPWNQAVRERLTELRQRETATFDAAEEESAEERYERAQALVNRGELEAAARELEGILRVYPDFSPAHNDLAVLYYDRGAKDEALAHYEKAAALAPGNSTFQKNLADFYFVEGRDVDGAIGIYLELLRKEPRNVETLMSLGKICTLLDRPQEAESFYGKVAQLEPWNRDARECLDTLRNCA